MYKRYQGQQQWRATSNRWHLIRNIARVQMTALDSIQIVPGKTLQDVRDWSLSFDNVMKSDIGRQIFTKFLESEYSDENMMFWNACEDLRKEKSNGRCVNMIRDIFEMFVAPSAPLEINLDSKTKSELQRRMSRPDRRAFEPAQDAVYLLMKRDCYGRFVKSKVYHDFVAQMEQALGKNGARPN